MLYLNVLVNAKYRSYYTLDKYHVKIETVINYLINERKRQTIIKLTTNHFNIHLKTVRLF